MKKIYYYSLRVEEEQRVSIPQGAEILSVSVVKGDIRVSAIIDPKAPLETVRFSVIGTGWNVKFKDEVKHIGSVVTQTGDVDYVWHVFQHGAIRTD